ncbi:trithorax group protein osa isoform X2 [Aplysia californica]|uniref:Trithorax group protein osa isoform X2 n=1 Tax=Aplysia californica TaxID=6500 RepID=A0ABM0ZUJ9_APLCA|nr:trithorax group protein osa isoform X2 [Aplysia californica]
MVGSRLNVHLYRDSFQTPWGFRLQGGKDLVQPLVVQRVFSNSPAEGELQRGDVILSINNRDGNQLTHKQAQDLIKHGGGQVQLVVSRPPPGSHIAPLSPPIVTQQPRAPSLQGFASPKQQPPSRPTQMSMYDRDYYPQYSPGGGPDQYRQQKPPAAPHHQPLHVQAPPPDRHRTSYSQPPTTPTTPTPPWAAQQAAPKRVSKLSKLGGGGGFNFGVDYATLPRSRSQSSAQYGARRPRTTSDSIDGPEDIEPDRLASGPVPKVCSLRNLGGGGYDFGSSFGASATLPRRSTGRRLSQPPSMPGGGSGFMPRKISLNRLGGGGPDFGSDFTQGRGGQTPAQRYEPVRDSSTMLNRVHTSLDTITLSPRTPEVQQSSPFYQAYEPTPQYQAPPPQQMYTPTGILLEQQRLQEQQQDEGEDIVPVWERRKQFQQGSGQDAGVRTPANKPPPRIPKPKPGPSSYGNFGTDYRTPQQKASTATWRPSPQQFKPNPAPVTVVPVQYKPSPPAPVSPAAPPAPAPIYQIPVQTSTQGWQKPPQVEDDSMPAWRNTLRSTGVKPWEQDATFGQEHEPARSVPSQQSPRAVAGGYSPTAAPFSPTQTPVVPVAGGNSQDGPKVVHLQYNSPMGLYSNQNVQETLHGQTQAMSDQTKPPPPQTNQAGDRDWSQSAVLRFIEQDKKRGPKKAGPPPTAPKPHVFQPAPQQQPFYDEIGASDF